MTNFSEIAALLVAQAPRQKADGLLALLTARAKARAGGVLSVQEDRVVVFAASRDLAVDAMGRAFLVYDSNRRALDGDKHVIVGQDVVSPIFNEGRLVGLLYLDTPEAFDRDAVRPFELTFAKAIEAEALGLDTGADAVMAASGGKEKLFALLQREEWNIARVARLMGVTRRTIYMRMGRYGIERQRVPRSNTPRKTVLA